MVVLKDAFSPTSQKKNLSNSDDTLLAVDIAMMGVTDLTQSNFLFPYLICF